MMRRTTRDLSSRQTCGLEGAEEQQRAFQREMVTWMVAMTRLSAGSMTSERCSGACPSAFHHHMQFLTSSYCTVLVLVL